ncbi:MAG: 30S ribosome-binding factor RbfA [Planctomycetota bacterium]|nr:MAG: 30S ribosome-binding factor RbfA [Planctomycetota bacterium]
MASERRRRQIARTIQQRLARVLLYELKDPRADFLTVTGVEINDDLTLARVRYTVLDPSARGRVAAMLEHAHGFLRRQVAAAVRLRTAPQVVFEYDRGAEAAARIDAILDRVLPREGGREELREEDQPDDDA